MTCPHNMPKAFPCPMCSQEAIARATVRTCPNCDAPHDEAGLCPKCTHLYGDCDQRICRLCEREHAEGK